MKPVLSKLHTYVSLATPHVGSLFPASQIVSTGAALWDTTAIAIILCAMC